jgi:hypothetical protein
MSQRLAYQASASARGANNAQGCRSEDLRAVGMRCALIARPGLPHRPYVSEGWAQPNLIRSRLLRTPKTSSTRDPADQW